MSTPTAPPPSQPLPPPIPALDTSATATTTTTTTSPIPPQPSPAAPEASTSTTTPHPLAPTTSRSSERHEEGVAKDGKGTVTPPVPMVHLRALVISGQSHVFTFEPETTVGRMKELVWSMWPSDWSSPAQPPSPSFLRVLHAGRILGDDSTLTGNNLPTALTPNAPTVIHISVRSFSIRADDDPKKASPERSRTGRNSAGGREDAVSGCKCVIM